MLGAGKDARYLLTNKGELMDLQSTIKWFTDLKAQGVSKDDILDVLEFDSDQYPDMTILNEAKRIVYGE